MELITESPGRTMEFASVLGEIAPPGTLLVLEGPLGAGKTSFVQGLAQGLGIFGIVNSPTYNIVKEYSGRLALYHFDLYRLEDPQELWELGLDEYLTSGGVCALEWGRRAEELLPQEHLKIRLEHRGETIRLITLEPSGEVHTKLAKELMSHVDFGNR